MHDIGERYACIDIDSIEASQRLPMRGKGAISKTPCSQYV
jgi:hypothetical protein